MRKLLCKIIGHKISVVYKNSASVYCGRCGKRARLSGSFKDNCILNINLG